MPGRDGRWPVSEYRSPEEDRLQREVRDRIQTVLDQAVRDGAFLKVAMVLHEESEVVERWVNRLYDGLRDGLSDDHPVSGDGLTQEDRLAAIVMLLEERMNVEAKSVMREVRGVGDRPC